MQRLIQYILCLTLFIGSGSLSANLYACGETEEVSCSNHNGSIQEVNEMDCCSSDSSDDEEKGCCNECACCASGIAVGVGLVLNYQSLFNEFDQVANLTFVSSYYHLFNSPIWQPPQLVH